MGYILDPLSQYLLATHVVNTISFKTLISDSASHLNTEQHALLQALFAVYLNKIWKMPSIFPEEYGEAVFKPLGFARDTLHQLQMELVL